MGITDLMHEEKTELSESIIHLWEDLLPSIMLLDFEYIELNHNLALFETSIRAFLLNSNVPANLVYPIYRMNGYENGNQILRKDKTIKMPSVPKLEDLYESLTNTMSI